jgi:UDP-glucose 4-epimerase
MLNISPKPMRILITGGLGFLGLAVARHLKARGAYVVGIGHGRTVTALAQGYDRWLQADVSEASLLKLNESFDVVVHCAGRSSVAWSLENPLGDFRASVNSTAELLEYLRCHNSEATLIFPSSAAIYGAAPDRPLLVSDYPNPISPYGFHKQITETLLDNYSKVFGQRCISVRFFSIYGPDLRKQLIWDAAKKLTAGASSALFWGTGKETRDWIYIEDAARLICDLIDSPHNLNVLNGASGIRMTIAETLEQLRIALKSRTRIEFNNQVKIGDPCYYHADIADAELIGWRPSVTLEEGLCKYAHWFKEISRVILV